MTGPINNLHRPTAPALLGLGELIAGKERRRRGERERETNVYQGNKEEEKSRGDENQTGCCP